MPTPDLDILDRLLDTLRASAEAQVVGAERLEALTVAVGKVHEDLDRRNALEGERLRQAASLWSKLGSRPALTLYIAGLYVVLAAAGVDPGPLIRTLIGSQHVTHVRETELSGAGDAIE